MAAGGGGGRDRYYCSVPLVKKDKMNEKVFTNPSQVMVSIMSTIYI